MNNLNICYCLNLTENENNERLLKFLQRFNWNYFITCRTPYKIHTMTVRNWVSKLFRRSHQVDNVFYVSERDKGDYYNS